MTHLPERPLPEWVAKRDGRLVPFEADQISRALFAASESLGRPDPFTARELTDGILHFLAVEADGNTVTAAQLSELVDAGARQRETRQRPPAQPAALEAEVLALAAEADDPRTLARRVGGAGLRTFALREVFARDLVAAHREGFLTLTRLETPFELAGITLGAPTGNHLVEALEEAREVAGGFVAVDGPEYALARLDAPRKAATFIRELMVGLRAADLEAVVNLNGAVPPSWGGELAEGPLFARQPQGVADDVLAHLADQLLDLMLDEPATRARIDWHLGERDFADAQAARLMRVVRRALEGAALHVTFDRARRPAALAEGIDRRHPAVLMAVGLHLPRLADQVEDLRPEQFLEKLGSLARLALSAGLQKRDFLRRRTRHWPPFLLDRARLVVVPVGLEAVTRRLFGAALGADEAALDFAGQVVRRLDDVLTKDGQARRLDTCLDTLPASASGSFLLNGAVAGVTPWDASVPLKQQVKVAGKLHAPTGRGSVAVLLSEEQLLPLDEVIDLLRWTWRHTDITRLRFVRPDPRRRQLVAPWEKSAANE
jgi:hypothetical protein